MPALHIQAYDTIFTTLLRAKRRRCSDTPRQFRQSNFCFRGNVFDGEVGQVILECYLSLHVMDDFKQNRTSTPGAVNDCELFYYWVIEADVVAGNAIRAAGFTDFMAVDAIPRGPITPCVSTNSDLLTLIPVIDPRTP